MSDNKVDDVATYVGDRAQRRLTAFERVVVAAILKATREEMEAFVAETFGSKLLERAAIEPPVDVEAGKRTADDYPCKRYFNDGFGNVAYCDRELGHYAGAGQPGGDHRGSTPSGRRILWWTGNAGDEGGEPPASPSGAPERLKVRWGRAGMDTIDPWEAGDKALGYVPVDYVLASKLDAAERRIVELETSRNGLRSELATALGDGDGHRRDVLRLHARIRELEAKIDGLTKAHDLRVLALRDLEEQLATMREAHHRAMQGWGKAVQEREEMAAKLHCDTGETWEDECTRARAQRESAWRDVADWLQHTVPGAAEMAARIRGEGNRRGRP